MFYLHGNEEELLRVRMQVNEILWASAVGLTHEKQNLRSKSDPVMKLPSPCLKSFLNMCMCV